MTSQNELLFGHALDNEDYPYAERIAAQAAIAGATTETTEPAQPSVEEP